MIEGRMKGKDIIMKTRMHAVDAAIALEVYYKVLDNEYLSYLELCVGIRVAVVA